MLLGGAWRQIFILGVYLHAVESRIHLAGRVLNSRGHSPNWIELGVTPEAIPKERGRWQRDHDQSASISPQRRNTKNEASESAIVWTATAESI